MFTFPSPKVTEQPLHTVRQPAPSPTIDTSMTTEIHHLFPNTFYTASLETWAAAIQRQLLSEAKKCILEKVVHYKALSSMEHEFLVIYASHSISGCKIVLGVDRIAQNHPTSPASNQNSGSASQHMNTIRPSSSLASTVASSSVQNLDLLFCALGDEEEEEPSRLAYDRVQVSHDGTPAPILAQHGPCVPLYTITFSRISPFLALSTITASDASCPPSLLHLSVLLLTIHTHFPSYNLFQYQCYFLARATCLALMDLFDGVETVLEEGKRAATWRGVHISLYSTGRTALQNMSRLLQQVDDPALIVPVVLLAAYNAVRLYGGNVVKSEADRRRIR